MRSALARVRGLGSAKAGTDHFMMQRLTAIANIILILWFIIQSVLMSGSDYAAWTAWLASPYHATMVILLVISSFYHAKLGLQVVIEDYIHHEGIKLLSIIAINLAFFSMGLACIISVIMVASKG